MNKEKLIRKVAKNGDFYISNTKKYFDVILETILETLAEGEDIKITGFGNFKVVDVEKSETMLHGEKIEVDAHKRVYFKLSGKAKQQLNH